MTSAPEPEQARPPVLVGVLATGVGGAAGALLRWWLTSAFPVEADRFPWTVFSINVAGSALLSALPLLAVVHRHRWLALFLGTGALGGFTTMSTASVDTFALLDAGEVGLGIAYSVGTLAAALLAVLLVDRLTTEGQRHEFENEEGDE